MCGIIGLLKSNLINENIYNILINGLYQLQNRGYDSTGVCVLNDDKFDIYKYASTNETNAIDKLKKLNLLSFKNIGIGHNRWATHGGKTDYNAHPHISNNKKFCLVHNGIIENYLLIKEKLLNNGYVFYSETDTEIIVNLIEYYYKELNNTYEAISKTINELNGTYGLIILNLDEPSTIYAVRNGSPLLLGKNNDYVILTSEQSGFCGRVNTYITLENNDIITISDSNGTINVKTNNKYENKNINKMDITLLPSPFNHWTVKEIYDQPKTILNSLNNGGRIESNDTVKLGGLMDKIDLLKSVKNIILLGCGTSYNAGLYGAHFIRDLCDFNIVSVIDGADFTIKNIPKQYENNSVSNTALILISQSGETKDLHRCIQIAKDNNMITIGIINVVDSLIAREADCGIYCNAGREIGVASTKAFTSQVVCLNLLAIWFAQIHKINQIKRSNYIKDLLKLSNDFFSTISSVNDQIINLAKEYCIFNNMFILGKNTDEITAREGSLKIKEISYIHSEAYSTASLKHGPFALLDKNFPVVIISSLDEYESKVLNCFEEVYSRESPIILITNNDKINITNKTYNKIVVPKNNTFSSLLSLIPLQLFAYYLSINKGINPDIPRNLAKVVTVE